MILVYSPTRNVLLFSLRRNRECFLLVSLGTHCPQWSQPAMTPNKEDTILGAEAFLPRSQNSPSGRRAWESHLICRQGASRMQTENGAP